MTQNIVTLKITPTDVAEVDTALDMLENRLSTLIELSVGERRTLVKMGTKSEAFCRQTLIVLEQNGHIIPPNFSIADAQQDLSDLDLLRPRFARLQRLAARAADTEMALGSDVYCAALEGYALAKVAGKGVVLDALRANAAARFGGQGKRKTQEEADPA